MSSQDLPENMETRVRRAENCGLSTVRRVAAMLNLNQDMFLEGQPLPRGWQFILLGADTPRSNLRGDGFPGLGVPLPDLGLPRLMLGGRKVRYFNDITIGETLMRESYVEKVSTKETAAGPMAIVTINHTMTSEIAGEVLSETQTYLMLSAQTGERKISDGPGLPDIADLTETIPDDLLLFQYSALGFNSHRIHWDREFARHTEGFPDLVVNGGLATLLLTEHLRRRHGSGFTNLSAKHTSPLFVSRPVHIAASERDGGWLLQAFDQDGRPAVEIETTT